MATLTDVTHNQVSDHLWFARSQMMVAPSDGYYSVIRIPHKGFITEVWLYIATAFTAAGSTLTVGWAGNGEVAVTNAFMSTDISDPTTAGMKRAKSDTLVSIDGKWFQTDRGVITVTCDDNGGTAGTFAVFALYAQIY